RCLPTVDFLAAVHFQGSMPIWNRTAWSRSTGRLRIFRRTEGRYHEKKLTVEKHVHPDDRYDRLPGNRPSVPKPSGGGDRQRRSGILWNGKQCLRHPSFDLLLQHTDGCLQDYFGTAGAEAVPKRPESVSRCADLRSDGRCAGRSEERRVGKEGRWRWG